MPVNVTCACGASYNLKDEYAGATLACPACGAAVTVPALPPAPPVRRQDGDPAFARDKFLLNQRHFAVSEKYTVADEDGTPVMYVERPRYVFMSVLAAIAGLLAFAVAFAALSTAAYSAKMAMPEDLRALGVLFSTACVFGAFFAAYAAACLVLPRRHITVYRDDSRGEVLLKALQDSRVQILTSSFTVLDPQGAPVAFIHKKYLRNIFRKRWYCRGADGEHMFTAKEDSIILSVLRRFLGSFFGLLRTDFIFYDHDENVLGEFNRKVTIGDRYVLDMTADHLRSVDRRAALAMGVLLDTGENR